MVLASTECQTFLLAWFSSSFVQSETRLRPSQLVWCQPCHWYDGIVVALWWHCGGIVRLKLLNFGHSCKKKHGMFWCMSHHRLFGE